MRTKALITLCAFVAICALATAPATAALKKYDVRGTTLTHFITASPEVERTFPDPKDPDVAVIDESGASPVLKKLLYLSDNHRTIIFPQLSGGFVFFSLKISEGPEANQTGTGSTASSITWGLATGWTLTGGQWCNSVPSYICTLGNVVSEATVDPFLESTAFDIGTWTFHGTGFRATPQVNFTTVDPGNSMRIIRGALAQDGTVPAVPLVGIGAVGASLIAMAWSALRRRS